MKIEANAYICGSFKPNYMLLCKQNKYTLNK